MKPHPSFQKIPEKSVQDQIKKEVQVKLHPRSGIDIILDPFQVARLLWIITASLLLVSLCASTLTGIDQIRRFGRWLNVDEEKNIPTCFSVFLLQSAAVLLTIISVMKWRKSPWKAFYWIILAAGFSFMAVDEGWSIHEMAGNLVKPVHGMILFSWVLVFSPLVFFLFIFFLKFLFDLPKKTSRLFFLSGCLYVGGAIGLESVSAFFFEFYGQKSISYILTVTLEEGFEMCGTILFIYALLDYMNGHFRQIRLNFISRY